AATSRKPISVGAGVPITGDYAADGQQMLRGLRLGVEHLNAAGGLLGRPLRLSVRDTKGQAPGDLTSTMRKFVAEKVAAVFVPYTTYTSVEFPVIAQAGMPMFHVNTYQGNLDYVRKHGYTNIYEGCPSQIWYGPGLIAVLKRLIASGAWKPSSKTAAIVASNDPYSLTIAQAFRKGMQAEGWSTTLFEEFSAPQADWGPVLVKIRREPPGVIFFSDAVVGDEASFIKQFRQAPTPSLVYQQYAPSVPEYLELAGKAADGVLWSTVLGLITSDDLGKRFMEDYQKRFNEQPGLSTAGAQYDLVRLWAGAAATAGDPYDFKRVNRALSQTIFRGVSGAYRFAPGELAPRPYPEEVNDASLGMPHLTFQIQDGKQALISPSPYATGTYRAPPWLK
ncbi:MAG TPA: branched-chain amino acid ABC transporter substrate-binding protein, partial [Solirubrobacteraceae bacterium]